MMAMHSGGRRHSHSAAAAVSSVLTLLIFAVLLPAFATPVSAAPTIRISLPGENPRVDGSGLPILQRGAWHEVVVTLDSPPTSEVLISAFLGTSLPPTPDNTNSYQWRYVVGGGFSDVFYGSYVDSANSTAAASVLTFRIGVEAGVVLGAWSMRLTVDTSPVALFPFTVSDPQVGLGISRADFVLLVEPYTAMVANSSESGQSFRVINTGTLPMALSIAFDREASRFGVSNWTGEIASGSQQAPTQRRHNLTFASDPWPPQSFAVTGTISATARYVIPSPNATQLIRVFQGLIPITVQVGHSGFSLDAFLGVSFEHQETVEASPNSILHLPAYLSGDATVEVSASVSGLTVEGAEIDGAAAALPATLVLSNTSQTQLTLTLRTGEAGANGTLTYRVSIPALAEERTFVSMIIVTAEPPPEDEDGGGLSPITVFLGAVLGVAGAFIAYNQIGAMRRRAKERETLLAQQRRRRGGGQRPPSASQKRRK